MLADGATGRWIATGILLFATVVAFSARSDSSLTSERDSKPARDPKLEAGDTIANRGTSHRRTDAAQVPSRDRLFVILREEPEWTGADEESDWSKSSRMVWDGPIQTWTTMRQVRVPSLNHRMIDSIEPVQPHTPEIFVMVRVVVPGDLEAALEWVRANPEVRYADVR